MELRQLSHFVAVAEERSFTRGAERVRVVQSGISVSVKSLERELGVELFDRSRTPVRLTDAGLALLPLARETLASAEAAKDAVAGVVGGMRGTVRLGLFQYPHVIDLPRLITEFLEDRPDVEVRPHLPAGGSADLVQGLVAGEIDVAVVAQPGGYPRELRHHLLGSETMYLACNEHHAFAGREKVAMRELDGQRFIDFPAGFGVQQSIERLLHEAGARRISVARVSDIATIAGLVAAGLGLAFLTQASAGRTPGVRLVPIHPRPQFDISLVYPRTRRLPAATSAFIDLVLATMPTAPA